MILSEKTTLYYHIKKTWAGTGVRFFYDDIEMHKYKEHVPKDKAIIFAVNHQCTFLDPIAVTIMSDRFPAFMTRSDIFKNPIAANFFYGYRMLPIYRKKDTPDFIEKNQGTFDNCSYLLAKEREFIIFVEGSHHHQRHLRTVKKGFAHIAFKAEEENNYDLDIYVVPVGMNYADQFKFKADLLINFGKPLRLLDYVDRYKENKEEAMNEITADLRDRLKDEIIHIENLDHYDAYEQFRVIGNKEVLATIEQHPDLLQNFQETRQEVLQNATPLAEKIGENTKDNKRQYKKFRADKILIDKLEQFEEAEPTAMKKLIDEVGDYFEKIGQIGFRNNLFENPTPTMDGVMSNALLLVLLLPFHLFGFFNAYHYYKIPTIISKRFKDKLFHSSVNWASGQILFTIFFPLQCLLFYLIVGNIWWTLLYMVCVPLCGMLSAWWWLRFTKIRKQYQYLKFSQNESEQWNVLKTQRQKIVDQLRRIVVQ